MVKNVIADAYRQSCPMKFIKTGKDAPWWNKELEMLRKETRTLHNKAKRTGNWEEYSRKLTVYNKSIRKAKRENFHSFCESIQKLEARARLEKIMKTVDGTFKAN